MTEQRLDPFENARRTGYTRPGYAPAYHDHRPRPPLAIVDLLTRLAGTRRPTLVVDLGSGTGLSTALWAPHAEQVIGIEPLDEMRAVAAASNTEPNVRFQADVAQATGLPEECVDIVTCAQSLHHMEPDGTLAEVGRVLRPGGVFAAYDYDWPPVVHPDAEEAFLACIRDLRKRHGIRTGMHQWDKAAHLDRMRASGRFRYTRELYLHSIEPCSAKRWVGLALTFVHVPAALALGLRDDGPGLRQLQEVAERVFRADNLPWHVSYSVRVGVK
jgi:SAM-dependent methyltransferase